LFGLSFFGKSLTPDEKRVSEFIREVFGFRPTNPQLFIQATTHTSAVKKDSEGEKFNNERLEFLGDAVLDVVVAEFIYKKYPKAPEGELTQLKSKVVSRQALNDMASHLGLHEHIIIGSGLTAIKDSVLGNALEAIIGAMYLDQGFLKTKRHVLKMLSKSRLNDRLKAISDYKSRLNTKCQQNGVKLSFRVESETRVGGTTTYTMSAWIDRKKVSTGTGESKKVAEQAASKIAWENLYERDEPA
jgi:ribonuclease III